MPERILLLSWTVPPETTGSAVIVGNLAKQFAREEMVVVGERPHGRPAVVWKDTWPEIVYATTGWPQTRRGARWRRKAQIPLLVLRCWHLTRRYHCTRLLVVFPNEEFLLAGYLIARVSGIPFYAYFHNTYIEQCNQDSWSYPFSRWLQRQVFERARHIFVMSDGMVELYRERYPRVVCSPLVHSFNEEIPECNVPPPPRTPIRFVLSGNINGSCEEAVVRVCEAISRIDSSLTILSGTDKRYIAELGILGPGVQCETVSRDILLARLAEADVVLLAHGFTGTLSDEEYRTIFPTKAIEYLLCGRPILAHTPPDCYLTRFLREHHCAFIVDDPSVEALLHAVHCLRNNADLRAELVRNALTTAQMFRASCVASTLRAVLAER